MDRIYLDHNATTRMLPEVAAAVDEANRAYFGNPASQHYWGRKARQAVEDAREEIATVLGANLSGPRPDRLIFTSGGTEANNLAILGLAGSEPGTMVTSPVEHSSVLGPVEQLARRGWQVLRLDVSSDGAVLPDQLQALLDSRPGAVQLVSVVLGSSETGVLQPVQELAKLAASAGVPLHTDAVQAAGKIPVNFSSRGVAALSASAHKFHGPKGIGCLLLREQAELQPQLFGGFQQQGLRPGTEPVPLVVGMQAALRAWQQTQVERTRQLTSLRDRFEQAIRAGWQEVTVNGGTAQRLPHTSNLGFPGLDRQGLLLALDLAGVACSTGSACASGSTNPSPTLVAMGLPESVIQGSLRFSLGVGLTAEDIDEAARRILQVCKDLRERSQAAKKPFASRQHAQNPL